MSDKILKVKETADRVGLSQRMIYLEISAGRFPRPVQLSPRRVGWLESEVDKWIESRVANRDQAA